jgi:hypothetical protein
MKGTVMVDLHTEKRIVDQMLAEAEYFWSKGEPYYARGKIYPEQELRARHKEITDRIEASRT